MLLYILSIAALYCGDKSEYCVLPFICGVGCCGCAVCWNEPKGAGDELPPPNNPPPEPKPPEFEGAAPNAGAGVLPNADGAGEEPNAVGAGVAPNPVEGAGADPNVVEDDDEAPKPKAGAGAFEFEVEPKENPPPLDDGAGAAAPNEKAILMCVIKKAPLCALCSN